MNHARIAAEALRFRMSTVQHALVDPTRFDVDSAAAFAVSCGDPVVDSAIRRLGTAWVQAGLDPAAMCEPWNPDDAAHLLAIGGAEIIDALDEVVRTICAQAVFRQHAATA